MSLFKEPMEFEWDESNSEKPRRHGLTIEETEEAFFDVDKVVFDDWKHSESEKRAILLGKTKKNKLLNIAFTLRKRRIRVITARVINKKEVKFYEKET